MTSTRKLAGGDDGGGGGGAGGGAVWILAKSILVGSTGQINCNGGVGGSTFGPADQVLIDGPSGQHDPATRRRVRQRLSSTRTGRARARAAAVVVAPAARSCCRAAMP